MQNKPGNTSKTIRCIWHNHHFIRENECLLVVVRIINRFNQVSMISHALDCVLVNDALIREQKLVWLLSSHQFHSRCRKSWTTELLNWGILAQMAPGLTRITWYRCWCPDKRPWVHHCYVSCGHTNDPLPCDLRPQFGQDCLRSREPPSHYASPWFRGCRHWWRR